MAASPAQVNLAFCSHLDGASTKPLVGKHFRRTTRRMRRSQRTQFAGDDHYAHQ